MKIGFNWPASEDMFKIVKMWQIWAKGQLMILSFVLTNLYFSHSYNFIYQF